jgi:transposase
MAPYPTELRVRVVAAVEGGGLAIPEAARIFRVGLTFIKKMLRLSRAGESLEPRHGGGPVPLLQEQEAALLRQELKARPDATLEELQQALTAKCRTTASLSTISRGLQVLNLPRKKKSESRSTKFLKEEREL